MLYAGGSYDSVKLYSESGNDTLTGGTGNDFLDGGDGNTPLKFLCASYRSQNRFLASGLPVETHHVATDLHSTFV
jgi:hypothetical protein